MKQINRLALLACALLFILMANSGSAQTTIRVFDTVLFFDGYATTVTTPAPQPGIIRHRNDLYARKLTAQELQAFGNRMDMEVVVKAACDNYDRIGNVNMALVPKGASSYIPDSVQRIELGRFITPFMNKNVQPDTVPYRYNLDHIAYLFQETSLTTNYDIWIELEIFGVPYAANTQIAGCSGRNDVFYGSLKFITNAAGAAQSNNVLVPLSFKKELNNYNANNTDTVGKTTRTINFNLNTNLTDAALFLITSNHGSNNGGEEYNRRSHYVFFDGAPVLSYIPGSTSCEPLRPYNTQANGIYGSSPRSDAQWQSFSNWCPGDTIPVRRIDLGPLAAGAHSFMITVPDAVFAGGQGYFPMSVYLQGKTSGKLAVAAVSSAGSGISIYPNPAMNTVTVEQSSAVQIKEISILNTIGQRVYQIHGPLQAKEVLQLSQLTAGLYTVHIQTSKGAFVQKLQVTK